MHLTEVTAIWVLTGEHLTGEITAEELVCVRFRGNGAGGGDCANTSNLQGYVNGAFIGMNASNNPSYGKTALFHLPCQWERHIKSSQTNTKLRLW
ncbi:hypothetical protein MU524_26460 (plasmid) [Escherichia coli]|uniref:hypothetical protein n=1 Tax=Escherichia coli TaxID=562 RepID=UPI001FF37C9E|nr:hypothetical protein [Escherichia coli]UOV99533.1 hypothetical protein MU524_26460 [Escherichia coli]